MLVSQLRLFFHVSVINEKSKKLILVNKLFLIQFDFSACGFKAQIRHW